MEQGNPATAPNHISRRAALMALAAPAVIARQAQQPQPEPHEREGFPPNSEDRKLPNGKSQKDAIAKDDHEKALKDAEDLVAMAEQLRDELKRAGDYVVPVSSVKKTEEIEKLARKIRGRLKD
ncbi:MAG: hypothetical protein JO270_21235 [Acidobacteriaceae bacterium]|nr:hypothetical protein [Acidobacteriaceae bacterium]